MLTGAPFGPVTVRRLMQSPHNAATVPSPPSAAGMVIISASGSAAATPAAIFFAASEADKLPLKLSGAAIIKGFPFLIYLTSARILSVFYHGTGNMSM